MGFGAGPAELAAWAGVPIDTVIDRLLNYESASTDHDAKIGLPEYVGITTASGQPFSANTLINDARQRWLFRMIHSQRPLEEKMALFWHNHFATAYSKIAGAVGQERATRMMDNDPNSFAGSEPGQIHKLRQLATGSFPTLLMTMAKDPAMIYWLDSQLNTRTRPQENFGREIMELFSFGVGNFTEAGRLCRGARVHRLQLADCRRPRREHRELVRISVPPERSRCRPPRLHLSDLSGRQPHHPRARGGALASRTPTI